MALKKSLQCGSLFFILLLLGACVSTPSYKDIRSDAQYQSVADVFAHGFGAEKTAEKMGGVVYKLPSDLDEWSNRYQFKKDFERLLEGLCDKQEESTQYGAISMGGIEKNPLRFFTHEARCKNLSGDILFYAVFANTNTQFSKTSEESPALIAFDGAAARNYQARVDVVEAKLTNEYSGTLFFKAGNIIKSAEFIKWYDANSRFNHFGARRDVPSFIGPQTSILDPESIYYPGDVREAIKTPEGKFTLTARASGEVNQSPMDIYQVGKSGLDAPYTDRIDTLIFRQAGGNEFSVLVSQIEKIVFHRPSDQRTLKLAAEKLYDAEREAQEAKAKEERREQHRRNKAAGREIRANGIASTVCMKQRFTNEFGNAHFDLKDKYIPGTLVAKVIKLYDENAMDIRIVGIGDLKLEHQRFDGNQWYLGDRPVSRGDTMTVKMKGWRACEISVGPGNFQKSRIKDFP